MNGEAIISGRKRKSLGTFKRVFMWQTTCNLNTDIPIYLSLVVAATGGYAYVYDFFLWRRAPQHVLRTHCSLDAHCATLWWRWRERRLVFFFSLFQVMEHRWNEIDRGKPKYSEKNLSQCHFVYHKSHMDWPRHRTQASAVGGRQLTSWAMARPYLRCILLKAIWLIKLVQAVKIWHVFQRCPIRILPVLLNILTEILRTLTKFLEAGDCKVP
jgi:hypothetical protein